MCFDDSLKLLFGSAVDVNLCIVDCKCMCDYQTDTQSPVGHKSDFIRNIDYLIKLKILIVGENVGI
jgi:hypothetical protein